jgi:outer membrane protein assembly factor BamA
MSSTVRPFALAELATVAVNTSAVKIVFIPNMAAYYHDRVPSARVMTSRLTAIAVALAVAACSSAPARRPRRPGDDVLTKIDITGNTALTDEVLIPGLSLYRAQRGGRGIDEYQLGIDVTRIEGAYQKLGYLSVEVEPVVERKGDQSTLTFKVAEGPRATVAVEISGLPPEVPADEARALVELQDGKPFAYSRFDAAKQPLLALLENTGYAHATLDASVLADRATNTTTLRYVVEPGPRVTFGEITIVGASETLAEAIRNRATFKSGDTYSTTAVAATQVAIYGIGRFSSVRIDVDRAELAAVVPVRISVKEAKRWEARAGIGAGLDSLTYQARLRFSLTHAGWPTPLTTLGTEFRPALTALRDNCSWYAVWDCTLEPRVRLLGNATQQDFLRAGVQGDIEGGLDYLALEAYTMQGARLRLGLGMPLYARRLHVRVGWQLAGYDFTDINPAVDAATQERIGIDHFQRLGAFTQGLVVDYRDNPVSPRLGAYAELRVAEGTSLAGGAFDYVQLTPDVRGYVPIGRTVIAARARVGVIRGDVPPTERYFAGGAASQRGFAERRLAPEAMGLDDQGNPISVVIGGAASIETGLEVRTQFKPWGVKLGVVGFLDGADVADSYGALDATRLHWAVGIGIRPFYLPVGPIRIEVAYRLNRTGAGEPSSGDRWNYLFGVGEAF